MPLLTLQTVDPSYRTWTSRGFGEMATFKVSFTDGTDGEVTTKKETISQRVEQYQDLIGKEREFTLEDRGSWPDGNPKPKKVKLALGGPGYSPQAPKFGTSARSPHNEEAITRAVALKAAVKVAEDPDMALIVADVFLKWLSKTAGEGQLNTTQGSGVPLGSTPEPSPASTSAVQGEGAADPWGEGDVPAASSSSHAHVWQPVPGRNLEACECGLARRKE